MKIRFLALIIFSIAFAYVESSVVFYLRKLSGNEFIHPVSDYRELLDLGAIAFIYSKDTILGDIKYQTVEIYREFMTLIMLVCVSYLSGKVFRERFGAFLVAFSLWDIFYYIFLKLMTGWPKTIFDMDIYFLIPVAWVGPVITPLFVSAVLFLVGLKLYFPKAHFP